MISKCPQCGEGSQTGTICFYCQQKALQFDSTYQITYMPPSVISRRDYFAAYALAGIFAKDREDWSWDDHVRYAVLAADQLIEELDKLEPQRSSIK